MSERYDTHLGWFTDPASNGDFVFAGRITGYDLARLRLDDFDKMVVRSAVESSADMLQSMEIIFRRLHEQTRQSQTCGDAP